MSTTTCACGNRLIWLSEQEAGECDACAWHRSWQQLMERWDREAAERKERERAEGSTQQ